MSHAARLAKTRALRAARALSTELPADSAAFGRAPRKDARFVPVASERVATSADLINAAPALRVDAANLEQALSFAFLTGNAGGSLASALTQAAVAPSAFRSDDFADALFVDELINGCFTFQVAGKSAALDRAHLRKLLCQPPRDTSSVRLRQGVLAELVADAGLLAALERSYQAILVLMALLDDEGSDSRLDMTQWRIDVLGAVRDAIHSLDARFAGARSALRRLHAFGEHARGSSAWQRLCALLDFEGESARAQLQVRLGADGSIRALEILAVTERTDSEFYVPPWQRVLRRLLLWLQGYRVGARDVVERWLEEVFVGIRPLLPALVQLKGDLEFYLGALHWKALAERKGLPVCLPTLTEAAAADSSKELRGLWNPLLLAQTNAPVATDVQLTSCACTCITTGPNSGGKTRFLQALALCQLLSECGCFAPARVAVLRRASGLFVSLGETSAADQEEGRLGMELVRIRRVFEHSAPGALIVLDELCSGTNPSEGEEIFRMLLELLHEVGHEVHVTTHFLSFAQRLTTEREALGLHFLQVELDADKRPTYAFVPGVATTSLAHQTAERLGVTREQLRELLVRASPPKPVTNP